MDLFYCIPPQFTSKSVDLASIAPLSALTGGDLHYMCPFDYCKHGEKLHYEIFRTLTRTQATDVSIKVRTSQGLSVQEYFGSFGTITA